MDINKSTDLGNREHLRREGSRSAQKKSSCAAVSQEASADLPENSEDGLRLQGCP